jgi:pimeloyl-ACP methyl ester carboxylesterase
LFGDGSGLVTSALYPFARRFFTRNGLRLHYLDEGQGEVVVMVHGNPTWSFHYRSLVLALRDSYRAIVPDHIGMGLSDKPDDSRYSYRLQSRIDDLEALLESVAPATQVNLVLHDWGGMIGMGWAARHPALVRRIVLLNTAAFQLPAQMKLPLALRVVRDTPAGPVLVRGFNAFSRTAARVCCTRRPLSREVRDAYCAPYDSWANRIATLRFVQDIPLRPTDPSHALAGSIEAGLPEFSKTPVLICWGDRDFVFRPAVLREWVKRWPQAQVHRFADCGHYVLEDAPAEIGALVREFLA